MGTVTRPAPDSPRWVRGVEAFLRGFQYLIWAALLAVTVVGLVTGSWFIAVFGAAVLALRVGTRRLITRNREEVDRWQRRGTRSE